MISRRQLLGCTVMVGSTSMPTAIWAKAALGSASSSSAEERALHALNRLAYGPRPADMAAIRSQGAEAWLKAFIDQQLDPQTLTMPAGLQARLEGLETQKLSQSELLGRFRRVVQAAAAAQRQPEGGQRPGAEAAEAEQPQARARRELVRPVVLQAAQARLARAIESPAQLQETLVEFWFNHFNVFVGKGPVSVLAGAYEREAIRPHVLGRFRDLLGATARHPAMLVYLDNAQSVRPGYRLPPRVAQANPNAPRLNGLNENYARELMELHTLGVDGGYTQQDVTELARMLTGWTVDQRAVRLGSSGSLFVFDASRHDTGTKQWLGHTVQGAGQAEGEFALDVLAAHPSTARHIAQKLAQAFVADQPPAALVQRLAERFLATQGDLKAVTRALIESDEFWSAERIGAKFKTPYHYLISSLRALGADTPADVQPMLQVLAQAGMPLYGAATPDGYKNVASAWMNPEALAQRVQFASALSERRARLGVRLDADAQRLMDTLGPLLSESTRQTVVAEPAPMRLALLLASPEFMKR
jgi:uncharacterized protein (DUF1800 family)